MERRHRSRVMPASVCLSVNMSAGRRPALKFNSEKFAIAAPAAVANLRMCRLGVARDLTGEARQVVSWARKSVIRID